jgi:hypothetical protein
MTIGDNISPLDDNPRQPSVTIAPQSRHNRKCVLKNRNLRVKILSSGKFA